MIVIEGALLISSVSGLNAMPNTATFLILFGISLTILEAFLISIFLGD